VGVSFDDELFPKVISKMTFNGQAEGSGPTWGGWGPKRLKKTARREQAGGAPSPPQDLMLPNANFKNLFADSERTNLAFLK
jgi:hypothetical protein